MRDPIEARADESEDLYDVAEWEPRTALDNLAMVIYGTGVFLLRLTVVLARVGLYLLGFLILLAILASGYGAIIIDNPFVLGLAVLSVIPAGLLALYVYRTDVTTREPGTLLMVTYILAILFAGFAAIVNSTLGIIQGFGLIGFLLFYYLVVGPVEEFVKLLAVRIYAYRDDRFDSVIDGAVYGAVAGLGFASIENLLYITRNLQGSSAMLTSITADFAAQFFEAVDAGGQIAAVRSLAGPGHVIYSAFAGYYLGLAKFNREHAVPIVIKGLLIAASIHATYNSLVSFVPPLVKEVVPGVPLIVVFFGFVVVYVGFFLYILYRKLQRYSRKYRQVNADVEGAANIDSELTEFDAD